MGFVSGPGLEVSIGDFVFTPGFRVRSGSLLENRFGVSRTSSEHTESER